MTRTVAYCCAATLLRENVARCLAVKEGDEESDSGIKGTELN